MEDSQTDNNSSCSEGGEKTGQAKIGGFVCIGKALLGRHPWRLSSPVSWGELVGASWNCLCLAQGSPSFSSQRFSAVSSGYHTCTQYSKVPVCPACQCPCGWQHKHLVHQPPA